MKHDQDIELIKHLYKTNNIEQIIDSNYAFFTLCLELKFNLGDGIKKLIDKGVKYQEIILGLQEALLDYPKEKLDKRDLQTLELINKSMVAKWIKKNLKN